MRFALTNFTGGEVAPSLSARYDLSRYKNSVQCMENFLPNVHGNVERRSGTKFIANLGSGIENDAVLFPFSFSVDAAQNFVLILSERKLRIAQFDNLIAEVEIDTPYAAKDIANISFAQVGDMVYLAHNNYALRKITRSGSAPDYTWALKAVNLNTSLNAPSGGVASFLHLPEWGQPATPLAHMLRYKVVAVDANGRHSLPSPAFGALAKHPSDWVIGEFVTLGWTGVSGAVEYNVYREEAGYFGFIGVSAGTAFFDNNYEADIADTPREDWNPFANGNNPGVVSFHQQRMVLAATPKSPQAFYMSRVGDFENFRKSRPLQEDDPVEYLIASGKIDSITWAASFGDLLLGTSGSEYKVSGDGGVVSPTNVNITAQSYWGSSNLFPIIIGNSVLHVQRHGARVRDLFYSLEKDGYAGNDLSIMAPHLFDGYSLRQWAYQQTPYSTVWVVRNDGALLALTYMKEHDIWGWSRHITQGKVRSLTSISGQDADEIYMVIEREINGQSSYYLERLNQRWSVDQGIEHAFFVDAGITKINEQPDNTITGLEHLEGCTVSILADGSPIENMQVKNGAVTIPYAASIIHVGLGFSSKLSPLPVEGDLQTGTTIGKQRGYGQCSVRIHDTIGGKYGANQEELYDFPHIPTNWGESVKPYSGHMDFIPGGGQGSDTSLWIVQDSPLPFCMSALVINLDISG